MVSRDLGSLGPADGTAIEFPLGGWRFGRGLIPVCAVLLLLLLPANRNCTGVSLALPYLFAGLLMLEGLPLVPLWAPMARVVRGGLLGVTLVLLCAPWLRSLKAAGAAAACMGLLLLGASEPVVSSGISEQAVGCALALAVYVAGLWLTIAGTCFGIRKRFAYSRYMVFVSVWGAISGFVCAVLGALAIYACNSSSIPIYAVAMALVSLTIVLIPLMIASGAGVGLLCLVPAIRDRVMPVAVRPPPVPAQPGNADQLPEGGVE